jgi:hypothetical protein
MVDAIKAGVIVARQVVTDAAPVDTTTLRRSFQDAPITMQKKDDSLTFSFGTPLAYAPTLELGLYKGVGPKTVESDGQIYSTQAVGGFMGVSVEKYKKEIKRAIIKRALQTTLTER